jgi:hypothetical protein
VLAAERFERRVGNLGDSLTPGLAGGADVALPALGEREVGLALRGPCGQHRLEAIAVLPPRLVDGPRGGAGLGERLHTIGSRLVAGFLDRRRERIALRRELLERELVEGVNRFLQPARCVLWRVRHDCRIA